MKNDNNKQVFNHSLAIPSDFKEIDKVQDFARNVLSSCDYPNETQQDIILALQEGVNNAIKHGNGSLPDQEVSINMTVYDSHLELRIRDNGLGFDRDQLKDPTNPEERMRCNGRGLLFIENYMDEICFVRNAGYHELKMIRYR
ncbi:MAG: ATP-binding protein [Candidatus Marinimicrobia bacterium]|nr:ATP-binding protein [Candidatus Neomarinimicrobiota bacterium]MCF7850549.1 ATP-binding protein [Candidatus Neomarinimicrobiota bacterium]MCF7904123.1 ATP-binding protein [Candidatus Neomarinimicrobiota bacterium]